MDTLKMNKKLYLRSFGCQMNMRDSEVICGLGHQKDYCISEVKYFKGVRFKISEIEDWLKKRKRKGRSAYRLNMADF